MFDIFLIQAITILLVILSLKFLNLLLSCPLIIKLTLSRKRILVYLICINSLTPPSLYGIITFILASSSIFLTVTYASAFLKLFGRSQLIYAQMKLSIFLLLQTHLINILLQKFLFPYYIFIVLFFYTYYLICLQQFLRIWFLLLLGLESWHSSLLELSSNGAPRYIWQPLKINP